MKYSNKSFWNSVWFSLLQQSITISLKQRLKTTGYSILSTKNSKLTNRILNNNTEWCFPFEIASDNDLIICDQITVITTVTVQRISKVDWKLNRKMLWNRHKYCWRPLRKGAFSRLMLFLLKLRFTKTRN